MSGDQYFGAKASINVWAPRVANQYEFSLSQMWVISGSFGDDLNTIEAGWQVHLFFYFLVSSFAWIERKEKEVEGNKVKLVKNKLIFSQIYSTLLPFIFMNPNEPERGLIPTH